MFMSSPIYWNLAEWVIVGCFCDSLIKYYVCKIYSKTFRPFCYFNTLDSRYALYLTSPLKNNFWHHLSTPWHFLIILAFFVQFHHTNLNKVFFAVLLLFLDPKIFSGVLYHCFELQECLVILFQMPLLVLW